MEPPRTADRVECLLVGSRPDRHTYDRIGPAEFLDCLNRVFCLAIHGVVRAELLCQLQLLINQIHGHNRSAGNLGILHGQVPETANAEDGDQV